MAVEIDTDALNAVNDLLDLNESALACPHKAWAELRRIGPVVWVERIGAYAVSRYDEIAAVMSDPDTYSSAIGDPRGPTIGRRLAETRAELAHSSDEFRALVDRIQPDWRGHPVLVSSDGHIHTHQRRLVSGMFSLRRAAALQPWVQERADEIARALVGSSEPVEMVAAFCTAIPLRVIADQLGIDRERIPDFKRWASSLNSMMGNDTFSPGQVVAATRANVEFSEYFRPLLDARRECPKDDFITKTVQATDPAGMFTDEIRLAMISEMISAGHDTSARTLAASVAYLARHPYTADALRADPALIERFTEEILRLTAPVQGLFRTVRHDTSLAGVELRSGDVLLILHGSANRTEEHFPHPGEVDLDRSNLANHLTFGKGVHFCPGAPLARVMIGCGIRSLLTHLSNWSIDNAAGGESWHRSYLLSGREQLWVRFDSPAR